MTLADETTDAVKDSSAGQRTPKEPTTSMGLSSKPPAPAHLPSRPTGGLVLLSSTGSAVPLSNLQTSTAQVATAPAGEAQLEPVALPAKKPKRARARAGKENAGKGAQSKAKVRKVTG